MARPPISFQDAFASEDLETLNLAVSALASLMKQRPEFTQHAKPGHLYEIKLSFQVAPCGQHVIARTVRNYCCNCDGDPCKHFTEAT